MGRKLMALNILCPTVCGWTCEVEQSEVVVDNSGLFTLSVHVSSDNIDRLVLRSYDIDTDLTTIDGIDLVLDSGNTYSSEDYPGEILWNVFPSPDGVVALLLGRVLTEPTGVYMTQLIVRDSVTAPNGVLWGHFRIRNYNNE
jgi:hypothetical protein